MALWPSSLAARTALLLLGGLLVSQVGGLSLHALDRAQLLLAAQKRELSLEVLTIYRNVVRAPPELRTALIEQSSAASGIALRLSSDPAAIDLPPAPASLRRVILPDNQLAAMPPSLRPLAARLHSDAHEERAWVALQTPEGAWLEGDLVLAPIRPWQSSAFLAAFAAMSVAAAALTVWAVRRLIRPVGTLAAAAEALGRDVNAPPLPQTGPAELAMAATAFNTMAARIRRFVDDRTFLLTAIGHDLRTPITRLRLRAEFMDDEEQRRRMIRDLDELEAMVAATLVFGQDATLAEPATRIDLAALLATVLNEASDARTAPDDPQIGLSGPTHLPIVARPVSLKRALTNLVANALNYGGNLHATLLPPADGLATLHIDDTGPGIDPGDLERVFQPFLRLEASRNRETGGVGLGLSIARNILRAHGGDVVLSNRPEGGLRATVTLPS